MKSYLRLVFFMVLPAMLLPWAVSGADAPKVLTEAAAATAGGGEEALKAQRAAKARQIEAKIGREGLTLADDNTLRIEPAPELEALRGNPRHRETLTVSGDLALNDVRADCLEISAVIEPGDAKEFGLKIRCSPEGDDQTVVVCSPSEKTLKLELAKSSPNAKYTWGKSEVKEQAAPFELKPGEPLRLRVFLDRSVLEVYANGRQCVTQRIYPSRPDSLGVALVSRGGSVKVKSLDAWDMSPANSW